MKRTLFIIDSNNVGGVEKRFSYLFKYLAQKSISEDAIVFLVNRKLYEKIEHYKAKIFNPLIRFSCFGTKFFQKGFLSKIIIRIIEISDLFLFALRFGNSYETIVFVTTKSLRYRNIFIGKRKIIIVYAYNISKEYKSYQLYEKIGQNGYFFDCLSENIAKVIKEIKGINKNQVFVSPNSFIDYEGSDNDFTKKEDLVAFVARFDKTKGIDLLLGAIDYVLAKSSVIKFIIIGYGPLKELIMSHVQLKGYDNKVAIMFLKKPVEGLVKSKVFLSLQLEENYPSQSLIEAMACKNAIIATDVGLTYKLVDKNTGRRVSKDPVEIGKAILEMFNDETILKQLAQNAREKVIKTHTVENFFDYLMRIGIN